MPRIDDRTEQFLRQFSQALAELYGEDLVSVILYGSAVGPDYLPEVSDLNVLIVLKEVTPARLKTARSLLKTFKKTRIEPLFLTQEQLLALGDSYPIEAAEIKERHLIPHGEDPLEGLSVSKKGLRLQLASELVGKTFKLRSLYLEAIGDARRLEEAIGRVVGPFGALMRTMLRLSDERFPPPQEFLEVVTQLEERFGLELVGFRDAYQVKCGMKRLMREELEALFERILNEAEELARRTPEIAGHKS